MLDLLRKNTRSVGTYLMFAIIIVVFAFTFGAITPDQACSGQGPNANVELADVDGQMIDLAMVRFAAEMSQGPPEPKDWSVDSPQAYVFSQSRFVRARLYDELGAPGTLGRPTFNRDVAETSPLYTEKLLHELIETKLVGKWARDRGMAVSNAEMNERLVILTNSFKDEKGAFDEAGWINYVRNRGTTPAAFEQFIKDEILRARVADLIVGAVEADDAEVAFHHRLHNEKVKIGFIPVDTASAKPLVPIDDKALADWTVANQDAVQKEYDRVKATKYTTKQKVELRGIKVEAPSRRAIATDATDEQKPALEAERAEAKKAADAMFTSLTELLAAVKDAPAPETPEAPAATAQTVFATFAADKSDDDATKANGGSFGRAFTIDELGRIPFEPAVKAAVKDLAVDALSPVVEVDDGYWLFMPSKLHAPVETPFNDARADIAEELYRDEQVEAFAKTLADEVLAEAKKDPKVALADVAKAINAKYGVTEEGAGLQAQDSQPFPRLEMPFIPQLPPSPPRVTGIGALPVELVTAAFAADADAPLLDQVFHIEQQDRRVIARWQGLEPAGEQEADDIEAARAELTLEKQRRLYRGWYDALLSAALNAGDVELEDGWHDYREQEVASFRDRGGNLPGEAAPAPAPAPETAETANN